MGQEHGGRDQGSSREDGGAHAHALPAGTQRVPAHRPRQGHELQLRRGEALRRGVLPALRRHQPRGREEGVHRQHHRERQVPRARAVEDHVLVRLLPEALRLRGAAHQQRQGLRVPHDRRADQGEQEAEEGAEAEPVARSPHRGVAEGVRPHAPRLLRGGRGHAQAEDGHHARQPEHVGHRGVPHHLQGAPARGRPVVRVPHVRLHALHHRLARGHHALVLHDGVREPPRELLLAAGRTKHLQAQRVGVRAPQHREQRALQAQAQAARHGQPRQRLGRSAPADDQRAQEARLHSRGHQRVLCRDGRVSLHRRVGPVRAPRAVRAPGAQPRQPAADGGHGPAEARHHQHGRQGAQGLHVPRLPRDFARARRLERARVRGAPDQRRVHRAQGLPRQGQQEVLRPHAGQDGAAAARRRGHLRPLRRRRQGPPDGRVLHGRLGAREGREEGLPALGVEPRARQEAAGGDGQPLREAVHCRTTWPGR
mmetsp:Transcript_27497/g.53415  ORF Transcript_27497/g.53415 Transcript_27497/m.53415 type:complete len:482 (+) Transcript_27497:868-2313(+)